LADINEATGRPMPAEAGATAQSNPSPLPHSAK
jgi:hypothetical protein